jgi:pilus assembly protein TadC
MNEPNKILNNLPKEQRATMTVLIAGFAFFGVAVESLVVHIEYRDWIEVAAACVLLVASVFCIYKPSILAKILMKSDKGGKSGVQEEGTKGDDGKGGV